MARQWTVCTRCRYHSECRIGQVRTRNIDKTSFMTSDLGCYNYDQYYNLLNDMQLNLFRQGKGKGGKGDKGESKDGKSEEVSRPFLHR